MDVEKILQSMTLEDKIALCSGKSVWETKAFEKYGVPSLFLCDGPHGLRKQERTGAADMLGVNRSRPATCFPSAVTTADSWDSALLSEIGAAIGEEARDQGVGLVLGPGANLKRNPLCGRNFEYFSEDPFLAGKLAVGFIRGVEAQGVGSSLKHFAANSQETCRFTSDSVMDERTLRELYLPAFEMAVKEGGPATVMCAYPKLNGVHCSDHRALLTGILRQEWGFDGMVVTDWGAMNDRIEGFRAGCDLNMPGGSAYMEREALAAVRSGALPEAAVDACARRVLQLVFRAAKTLRQTAQCDYDAHHALAAKAAAAGAVLLKNEGGILPLREGQRAALLGHMAREMRFQGAGSSHINPTRLTHPVDAMPDLPFAPGCDAWGDTTDALLAEAVALAKSVDVPVVFAGLPGRYESEGFDRSDMKLPEGQLRLIDAVAAANPNTVVVLLCGAPVECPWADRVRAILYMGLPGQAGGQAAADLLYGRVSPSGRLAESWPLRYEDCPSAAFYGKTKDALYLEGVYVGYRYYDKAKRAVRWPFGYGLSYTAFGYSDLKAEGRTVTVAVTNTGVVPAAEVVQLYVCPPQDGVHRPVRELKGFQKVFLQPGETRTVSFVLDDRAFALWQDGWKTPAGIYGVEIGGLTAQISVEGEVLPIPRWQAGSWYADCVGTPSQAGWEAVLGRKYVPVIPQKGAFTMDNTVVEMKAFSRVMKIMYWVVALVISGGPGKRADRESPEFRMMMEASVGGPLRSMQISSGIRGGLFRGLLEIANGHFFKGIGKMLRG